MVRPSLVFIEQWRRAVYMFVVVVVVVVVVVEKRVDPSNRVYFVNHKNRTTQWEDPRIQGYELCY